MGWLAHQGMQKVVMRDLHTKQHLGSLWIRRSYCSNQNEIVLGSFHFPEPTRTFVGRWRMFQPKKVINLVIFNKMLTEPL